MGTNSHKGKLKMRIILNLSLISLSLGAPQYSDAQSGALDAGSLDTIAEIFGTSGKQVDDGYGTGQQTEALSDDVDVLVQVIKGSDNGYPDDYVPESAQQVVDKATVEVNTDFENCADYTDLLGYECVPYYQCHNGSIITDGAGLIDIRNGFGSLTPEDSKCPGFLDVCCKDPDFIPPPPPKIKYAPKCGRRNQNGLGVRIQGFTESESQFGEWPHMCAILHEKPIEQEGGYGGEPQTVNLYQCGGSLIAPGVILTAAHCVDNFVSSLDQLKVRCGEWDTQNETEPYPHQDRYVQVMKIHPEFNAKNLHNDFAVLFTTLEFDLSSHIDTVCIPGPEEDNVNKTDCYATGWGKDRFGSRGEYQVVLKEIDLPLVENEQCQDLLRKTKLGDKFKLDDSFLCAGGVNGKDTCHGVGGSPLVCKSKSDPETFIQSGIVSWGVGCGEDGTPGVYASVAKAACWIDYVMSCQYGKSEGQALSVLGYSNQECGAWVERSLLGLSKKKEGIAKHMIPMVDAEIEQFNRCKVNWVEGDQGESLMIPDGSKLVQDEDVKIHELNNSTDTGYGNGEETKETDSEFNRNNEENEDSSYVDESLDIIDGSTTAQDEVENIYELNNITDAGYVNADEYEKTESDLIQKNEGDEDSSYITKASEHQQGIANNAEQNKEINDISNIKTSTEIPDDLKSVELEQDDENGINSITEESYTKYDEEKLEIDVSSSQVDSNEEINNLVEDTTDTIVVDQLLGEDKEATNQYLESNETPVHITDFEDNDNTDKDHSSQDEKLYPDTKNVTLTINKEVMDNEESGENIKLVKIINNTANSTETDEIIKIGEANLPNDYVAGVDDGLTDEASVEVNYEFENCVEYTEKYGYECVPYYQCHNGTIITDGAGLIDIRNGFGSLTPEDSKCPGFLDVCCKDPDFIPPPPPK